MQINSQLCISGNYKRQRCVLRLLRNMSTKYHHIVVHFTFKEHRQSISHGLIGDKFTVLLDKLPIEALVHAGSMTYSFDQKQLSKLKAESDLRFLLDKLLANHPHSLLYRYESI